MEALYHAGFVFSYELIRLQLRTYLDRPCSSGPATLKPPQYVLWFAAYFDESGDDELRRVKPIDPDGSSEWFIISYAAVTRCLRGRRAHLGVQRSVKGDAIKGRCISTWIRVCFTAAGGHGVRKAKWPELVTTRDSCGADRLFSATSTYGATHRRHRARIAKAVPASAPVASGWSGRRVGPAPTGKAPPCHGAHGEQTAIVRSSMDRRF